MAAISLIAVSFRMAERFRELLGEWKAADLQASEAQNALNAKFQAFLLGESEPPTDAERQQVMALRALANTKLEVALAYVKSSARGPSSSG